MILGACNATCNAFSFHNRVFEMVKKGDGGKYVGCHAGNNISDIGLIGLIGHR